MTTYDAIVVGARCAGSPTAMLLARQGYRVLLVDRAAFPSDTISTHMIWQTGISRLKRWGLLDRLAASNCPLVTGLTMDLGDFPLTGWEPPADGVSDSYGPRRIVLDKVLVDAAVEAGVELRERFTLESLDFDGDVVTGIKGRDRSRSTITEKARIVIGADGKHSPVARAVRAPEYNVHPSLSCFYYTYWSELDIENYEVHWPDRRFILAVPTNDGLTLVTTGWPIGEFHEFRSDIEGNYMKTIDLAPRLAERVRSARREEKFVGTADLDNFFRRPYGAGWALVGDAGYHKDPITAYGISDAFRDAELLADAIDEGFSGRSPLEQALAGYERKRNEVAMPQYERTVRAAAYRPHPAGAYALRAALRGNQEDTDAFVGVAAGTFDRDEFFAEENVQRIMAEAERRNEAT